MDDEELRAMASMRPADIVIQDGSSSISVTMDAVLMTTLSAPPESPCTKAASWFHCQMIRACDMDAGYDLLHSSLAEAS